MAYEKTWTFSPNNTPIDQSTLQKQCQSWMIQLKEFLVASAGWTVVESSNGGNYSTADNWGTDLNNIVWNTSAGARSWILLKSPVGIIAGPDGSYLGNQSRVYLVIDCAGAAGATAYNYWRVTLHHTQPAGGSTAAIPTSTDELTLAAYGAVFTRAALVGNYFHFGRTAQGHFYALISLANTYICHTVFTIPPITDVGKYGALDYPYGIIGWISARDAVNHPLAAGGYIGDPNAQPSMVQYPARSWNMDGTALTPSVHVLKHIYNDLTHLGAYDGLLGHINNQINTTNYYFFGYATNKRCYLGKMADILVSGFAFTTNTTVDQDPPNVAYCWFYNYLFPTNARFLA
jgi:hypothetical protein